MLFSKKTKPGDYEIIKEGKEEAIYFNYSGYPYSPSIEDSEFCMSKVIDALAQNPSVTRIVFNQMKNYEYPYDQTQMLIEVATIYNYFVKQKKIITLSDLGMDVRTYLPNAYADLQYIILNLLRTDPIGAYIELTRLIREEIIKLKKTTDAKAIRYIEFYIKTLTTIRNFLDKTRLVSLIKPN